MINFLTFLSIILLSIPAQTYAGNGAGEKLFQSTALGSNGKACKSCHAQGHGLKKLGEYDSTVLQGLINICIEDALKGKPFSDNAQQLKDLEEYIRLLGSE